MYFKSSINPIRHSLLDAMALGREKAGAGPLGRLVTGLGNTEAPYRSTEPRSSARFVPRPASPGPPRQVVLSKQRAHSFHPPLSTRHGLFSGKRPSTGSGSPSSSSSPYPLFANYTVSKYEHRTHPHHIYHPHPSSVHHTPCYLILLPSPYIPEAIRPYRAVP